MHSKWKNPQDTLDKNQNVQPGGLFFVFLKVPFSWFLNSSCDQGDISFEMTLRVCGTMASRKLERRQCGAGQAAFDMDMCSPITYCDGTAAEQFPVLTLVQCAYTVFVCI